MNKMFEKKLTEYRFSFGPWNIHQGSDPFGPDVRSMYSFNDKIDFYEKLGFVGVQFHDDDVVPNLNVLSNKQIIEKAREIKKLLDRKGLIAEFVAPRLWEDSRTIDGAYTSNNPKDREYAIKRTLTAIDIANELGTNKIVLWLAREGTYIRESKKSFVAIKLIVKALNRMLEYDKRIKILIEPKPNEPMDQSYIPTIGHAIGLTYNTIDPSRVGALIESAHCILAGLDPSDEMGYALYHDKLWSVHLNDQNGLKFDEDKSFGSVNIRRAFNQVRVLEEGGYGRNGDFIGLDVKTMRTQSKDQSTKHLSNSKKTFLYLLNKVRSIDKQKEKILIQSRDYEELDLFILEHLMNT
jgi:xylose isomerase